MAILNFTSSNSAFAGSVNQTLALKDQNSINFTYKVLNVPRTLLMRLPAHQVRLFKRLFLDHQQWLLDLIWHRHA